MQIIIQSFLTFEEEDAMKFAKIASFTKKFLFIGTMFASPCYARSASDAGIAPGFDDIKAAIEAFEAEHPGQTLSIAAILERLPESFRSRFSLMHQSQSLQEASYENPRIIMFGNDARTVMAFNGHPSQPGYGNLEIASVNPSNSQLEFRSIQFPPDDSGQGKAIFSQANPSRCMLCHGPSPHYIWGPYARWPGTYGSRDDILELGAEEKENYLRFRKLAVDHPRYKSLSFALNPQSPVAPFRPLKEGQPGTERGDYKLAIEFRPNFHLGTLLMRHQSHARSAAILGSPQFAAGRLGLFFYLADCPAVLEPKLTEQISALMGVDTIDNYVRKYFAIDPRSEWHLEKGETSIFDQPNYSPSLNTFRSSLLGFIWADTFKNDVELSRYWKPVRLGEYLKFSDPLGFKASERGQLMWDILDREGPIPSGVSGSFEAISYFGATQDLLSTEAKGTMCRTLALRIMAQ